MAGNGLNTGRTGNNLSETHSFQVVNFSIIRNKGMVFCRKFVFSSELWRVPNFFVVRNNIIKNITQIYYFEMINLSVLIS